MKRRVGTAQLGPTECCAYRLAIFTPVAEGMQLGPNPDIAGVVARVTRGDRLAGAELHAAMGTAARPAALDCLAVAAARGSTHALELLLDAVDQYHLADPAVRRLIFDHDSVEDVRQDVLVAVARSIGSFRGDARFTSWLYRVASNTAVAHLRRCRDEEPLPDVSEGGPTMSSMVATRAMLEAAIDRLDEPYRSAVMLRDVEQLSYREISNRLGLNLNTVKSHVARGRARVATELEGSR